jgi:hypothetical protein
MFRLNTALLEAHKRRSRKYQTPFERKREKEIKSLNSKVEQMKQEKLEKEEEIIDMRCLVFSATSFMSF